MRQVIIKDAEAKPQDSLRSRSSVFQRTTTPDFQGYMGSEGSNWSWGLLSSMNRYKSLETNLGFCHLMRCLVFPLDLTIITRRELEGNIEFCSDDDSLIDMINDFADNVVVGQWEGFAPQCGLQFLLNYLADSADEYGMGIAEIQYARRFSGIERILIPDMRSFSMDWDENKQRHVLTQRNGEDFANDHQAVKNPENLLTLSFSSVIEKGWPQPLCWGLTFPAEMLVRMLVSVNNAWFKGGDPSELWWVQVKETLEGGADFDMDEVVAKIQGQVAEILACRRDGLVADGFIGLPVGASLHKEVIGEIKDTLMSYLETHLSMIASLIHSKGHVPSFLFEYIKTAPAGIGSDKYRSQISMADRAASKRTTKLAKLAKRIVDKFLATQGIFNADYEVKVVTGSMEDRLTAAEIALTEAKAKAQVLDTALMGSEQGEDESAIMTVEQARKYAKENGFEDVFD